MKHQCATSPVVICGQFATFFISSYRNQVIKALFMINLTIGESTWKMLRIYF